MQSARERSIDAIVADPALPVATKSAELTATLFAQPGHGVDTAMNSLLATGDERVASFITEYLALFPGMREQKIRAAKRVRELPALTLAAARLVPWLPQDLLAAFIADYRARPDKRSPLYSVMFEIATFFPALLRPQLALFDSPSIRKALLSGAPDEWIDEHVERWRVQRDPAALDALARFRTRNAADTIENLRGEVEDRESWECWLEMAGRMPDGAAASFGSPAMGFVATKGASPHVMGGRIGGMVPLCPVCQRPGERVLTLSSAAFSFGLRTDPSFFWFACNCNALDAITVQERPEGRRIFFILSGESDATGQVIPREASLQLESHPNQVGVSMDATGGHSRHQVAGLPVWNQPEPLPHCPQCTRPMKFLASIDSGMTPFGRTGFGGTLFGFWCNECAVATTQRQA